MPPQATFKPIPDLNIFHSGLSSGGRHGSRTFHAALLPHISQKVPLHPSSVKWRMVCSKSSHRLSHTRPCGAHSFHRHQLPCPVISCPPPPVPGPPGPRSPDLISLLCKPPWHRIMPFVIVRTGPRSTCCQMGPQSGQVRYHQR